MPTTYQYKLTVVTDDDGNSKTQFEFPKDIPAFKVLTHLELDSEGIQKALVEKVKQLGYKSIDEAIKVSKEITL
jgi:hypothetical protein